MDINFSYIIELLLFLFLVEGWLVKWTESLNDGTESLLKLKFKCTKCINYIGVTIVIFIKVNSGTINIHEFKCFPSDDVPGILCSSCPHLQS